MYIIIFVINSYFLSICKCCLSNAAET